MTNVEKLIAAGVPAEMAWEAVHWLTMYGNDSDLQRYICEFKFRQRERINDG